MSTVSFQIEVEYGTDVNDFLRDIQEYQLTILGWTPALPDLGQKNPIITLGGAVEDAERFLEQFYGDFAPYDSIRKVAERLFVPLM